MVLNVQLQHIEGDGMEDALLGTFSYANIASKRAEILVFPFPDPPSDLGKCAAVPRRAKCVPE